MPNIKVNFTNEKGEVANSRLLHFVEMPENSDYLWQKKALQDRISHPERYAAAEDTEKVIASIKAWIKHYEDTYMKVA